MGRASVILYNVRDTVTVLGILWRILNALALACGVTE